MRNRPGILRNALRSRIRLLAFTPALLCAMAVIATPFAQAQTLHVLYALTDQPGGNLTGLVLDQAGNLYGTTSNGSVESVFELKHEHSSWLFQPRYYFHPQNDGRGPYAPVVFGPEGALYGTTIQGGNYGYLGTVYSVQPSADSCESALCLWDETRIYWFGGSNNIHDGSDPFTGPLIFDPAGNIYGTTLDGGLYGEGTAYQLVKTQNGWAENIIANLRNNDSPTNTNSGLTFDAAGNLYGTIGFAGAYGQVYELTPSGQAWQQQTIYSFQGGNDGAFPVGGLVFDAAGNAYGTTGGAYQVEPATVFQLSPQGDGTWRETVLYVFPGNGPINNLTMDAAGNIYGSTPGTPGINPDHYGMVFKLSPVGNSWTFTQLYEFTGGDDGAFPNGIVAVDSAGNLYGVCDAAGAHERGTIWEITP
jgi:hypothetical protein